MGDFGILPRKKKLKTPTKKVQGVGLNPPVKASLIDDSAPPEITNGMAALVTYAVVRYYVRRSMVCDTERAFIQGICNKFAELVKNAGAQQTVDIIKIVLQNLALRFTESGSTHGALEEYSLSSAIKSLGYVKKESKHVVQPSKLSSKPSGSDSPKTAKSISRKPRNGIRW